MTNGTNPEQAGPERSGLVALMYVSVCTIESTLADLEIAKIVRRATEKNSGLDITGALIFTGAHFAQVLEGRGDRVDRLMSEIMDDPRHRDVTIVERVAIRARRFAGWSLAYQGGATYVDRPIGGLLTDTTKEAGREYVHEIYAMMDEFTKP